MERRIRERALRNHMASHIIANEEGRWEGTSISSDPCMYCCSSIAQTACNVKIVGSSVVDECKTYSVERFSNSLLKPVKKFPSSNQPIKCQDCSEGRNQTPVFIPAYNMLKHCKQVHGLHNDEMRADELKKYAILADEKAKVVDLFKINP